MKLIHSFLIAASIAITGCSSTQFKAYEGRNSVVEGQGGTKSVVDGMEIWETGEPPRRFQLLGLIDDERSEAIVPAMMFKSDMVKKAREAGGQALIHIRSQSQITGYMTTGNATATTNGRVTSISGSADSMAMRKNKSTFAVIKYLD